jgi:hypothetical protein
MSSGSSDERIPLRFDVAQAPDLLPGRTVRFIGVALDATGVRVEYEIEPAVPRAPGSVGWVGVARDDLGNVWEDVGGAYGASPDGQRTEGVMTFELVDDTARLLTVRLAPAGHEAVSAERSAFELAISLVV